MTFNVYAALASQASFAVAWPLRLAQSGRGRTLLFFPVAACVLALFLTGPVRADATVDFPVLRGPLVAEITSRSTPLDGARPAFAHQAAPSLPVIPSTPLRTALVVLHVVGLVLGMGSALLLDLYMLPRLYNRAIDRHAIDLMHFGSILTGAGLVLLWCSGAGVLMFYYVVQPAALANPKLWAKLAIVTLLTINGGLLHRTVLPRLHEREGRPLLSGLPIGKAALPLFAGVVSATSWTLAALLGLVKELNYVVDCRLLLAVYALLLAGGLIVGAIVHGVASRRANMSHMAHSQWGPGFPSFPSKRRVKIRV